jgi:hypothetical protein
MRRFVLAVTIMSGLSGAALAEEATRPDIASWSATGNDLYEKCTSANSAVAHACAEYLLGLMTGIVISTPANAQIICPPSSVSFFQLELAYINWAKAHPELLSREPSLPAAAALRAVFPCSK